MQTQVFIHPQGIEGRRVKAGQKHIDHQQNIHLTVFHPLADIFMVILERGYALDSTCHNM